jgi:hypothetical protein
VPDFKSHRLKFTVQLVIPKAAHLDAAFRKKLISFVIFGPLVWKTVPAAVQFNREFCDRAVEIEEVDAARILSAEFEFVETVVTQQTPQLLFGLSRFLTEMAGEVESLGSAGAVFAVARLPPHPIPLPRWGRG